MLETEVGNLALGVSVPEATPPGLHALELDLGSRTTYLYARVGCHRAKLEPLGAWTAELLDAMGRMAKQKQVGFTPISLHIQPGDPLGVAAVAVALPVDVWGGASHWRPSPAAVLLLNALEPLQPSAQSGAVPGSLGHTQQEQEQVHEQQQQQQQYHHHHIAQQQCVQNEAAQQSSSQGVEEAVWARWRRQLHEQEDLRRQHTAGQHAYSLERMFQTLPSCTSDPQRPPLMHTSTSHHDSSADSLCAPAAPATTLSQLPEALMENIVGLLSPSDLARLSCTCRYACTLCLDVAPGLDLKLYPHQRAAVRRMLALETRGYGTTKEQEAPGPHPFIRKLVSRNGLFIYANLASGELQVDPPPQFEQMRGGFFCDEPGLGKTVTALALILRTRGSTPRPPPGTKAVWLQSERRMRVGFYTLDPAQATSGAGSGGSSSNSSRLPAKVGTRRSSRGYSMASLDTGMSGALSASGTCKRTTTKAGPGHQQLESPGTCKPAHSPPHKRQKQSQSVDCSGGTAASPCHMPGSQLPGSDGASPIWSPQGGCPIPQAHLSSPLLHPFVPQPPLPQPFQSQSPQVQPASMPGPIDCARPSMTSLPVPHQLHPHFHQHGMQQPLQHQQPLPLPQQLHHLHPQSSQQSNAPGQPGMVALGSQMPILQSLQVQCDACNKWRRLPTHHQVNDDEPWFCDMHPDATLRSCAVPEEKQEGNAEGGPQQGGGSIHDQGGLIIVLGLEKGFVPPGHPRCQPCNVSFFLKAIVKHLPSNCVNRHLNNPLSEQDAVRWLMQLKDVTQLQMRKGGVLMPKDARHPDGYEALFRAFHLCTLEDIARGNMAASPGSSKRRGKGSGGGVNGSRGSGSGGGAAQRQMQHRWVQTPEMGLQEFDIEALRAAWDQIWEQGFSAVANQCSERFVYMSPATLVIVPNQMLVPHWKQQIQMHISSQTLRVCELTNDRAAEPTPKDLAWNYDVVITTFARLSTAWQPSRFVAKMPGTKLAKANSSSLTQVHWLRIIIDEGHMLGSSLGETNRQQVACSLQADRRWVMTGTPTSSTPSSGINQLQPLLAFLHHQPYGYCRKEWEKSITQPLAACRPYGRQRLLELLRQTMIRACKADLRLLPPLHVRVTRLNFAPEHAQSYNDLVEVVRRNMLLADWHDEDHKESLMNEKQGKWAQEMIKNVRLSCCVAGSMNLEVKEDDVLETLELLSQRLGFEHPVHAWANFYARQQRALLGPTQEQQQQQQQQRCPKQSWQ
uniref:F-box domain-containing protein n=1 Tax=Dunaliella tertiolecta TaxID=3047 RepID=A0A6S8PQY3_DUNTE